VILATVAVVMAAMLLAMAMPAFAEPPPVGRGGCPIKLEIRDVPGNPPPEANRQSCERGFILV
jgi:hypothetical protein